MLVNIQSFITHTMFFSSYSSLHSINWMKANDTRTQQQQNINCVVIWPMVCVYARKFCALNHPYFCAYDIGIFRLLLKIPRNFKRWSNFFHITWCLHSHKKETECLPHSGKSMKNKSLPHCLQLDFSLFFFLLFFGWCRLLLTFCSSFSSLLLFICLCVLCVAKVPITFRLVKFTHSSAYLHTRMNSGYFIHQNAVNFFSFLLDFWFVDFNISTFSIHIINFSNSTNIGITNKLR